MSDPELNSNLDKTFRHWDRNWKLDRKGKTEWISRWPSKQGSVSIWDKTRWLHQIGIGKWWYGRIRLRKSIKTLRVIYPTRRYKGNATSPNKNS